MSDTFSPEISNRICEHMNEDHADAVLLYAKAYGNATTATAAQLVSIDANGMNLNAQIDGSETPLRIAFDHVLQDAQDAHHTLIEMVEQAKAT